MKRYRESGIKVPNDDYALKYIKENLHLLKNRPQVFQQGDFHVGNLILTPDDKLGVIDFNRWDYGDPYEDFFKILALYLADVSLYSVAWAAPFGEEDVNNMLQLVDMIFSDFNNFRTVVPDWFSE